MRSRDIRRLIAKDPGTVFLVSLPHRDEQFRLTGRREHVPVFIRQVAEGRAYLAPASPRSAPETFPVRMIVGRAP